MRGALSQIFNLAVDDRGYVAFNPTPKFKAPKGKKYPAMLGKDIPAAVTIIRAEPGIVARVLEFTILSGSRINEVLGATWKHIDGTVWNEHGNVDKKGMYARPLTSRMVEIIEGLPRNSNLVFDAVKYPQVEHLMKRLRKRHGWKDKFDRPVVTHGFRSTLTDWGGDIYEALIERQLGHGPKGTRGHYRREMDPEERRGLMQLAVFSLCNNRPIAA